MTVLTPPAALFEVISAVLTPLGHDFVAQVAPTWALGPSPTLQKTLFPFVFQTFQEIATFAMKSPNLKMPVLTPPAALSEATFGRPDPLWARLWAPRRPQRSLNASILTSFWLLCRTCLGPADRMAPRLAPGAQNQPKMCRKNDL